MQKLKISNIPHWITEIHLKQFFNHCGKIVHASVALDANTLRPLGEGYLIFADEIGMQNALAKNNALLDGARINVEIDISIPEETLEEI